MLIDTLSNTCSSVRLQKSKLFIKSCRGKEHLLLVIQIIRVEIIEENLVLVNSKKEKEGRNNFFSKTKNQRGKNKMLREIDSRTA